MSKEVWKEFEDNLLTHSAAHYLMTIHELLETQGYARVTDIAKRMNITRGSCSISLKPLKKRGWVTEDPNRFLKLSDEGRRLAQIVEKNDELLETFFREVLGVDAEQAEIDACKIEHLLSVESSVKLAAFIRLMREDDDAVKKFRDRLRRDAPACSHDVKECVVCREVCFFDEKPARRRTAAARVTVRRATAAAGA
jgi:Mn-dependent DtxR family transcriptional regulator